MLVDEERQRRVTDTPEAYVGVPVIVPKMSSVVQGAVADYELFWLVGLPGPIPHPKYPDKMAREAINFQCAREETCDDMVFMLNQARVQREMRDNAGGPATLQEEAASKLAEQAALLKDLDPGEVEDVLTGK